MHVSFPAKAAGTSPEGHEEACTRNDRALSARTTVDRTSGWRLESRANRNHTILPRRLSIHARPTRGSIEVLKSARIRSTPRAEHPVRTLGRRVDGASGGAWQAQPSMPASTGTGQLAVQDAERGEEHVLQTAGTLRSCKPSQRSTYGHIYACLHRRQWIKHCMGTRLHVRYALEGK